MLGPPLAVVLLSVPFVAMELQPTSVPHGSYDAFLTRIDAVGAEGAKR